MAGTCSIGARAAAADWAEAEGPAEAYCSLEEVEKLETVRGHARRGMRGPSLNRRRQGLAA